MVLGVAKTVITRKVTAAPGEFDFSTIGLTSSLDARAGVTVTGIGVSDWQDQGSANLDAVQTTDARRPTTGGAVSGIAALVFVAASSKFLDWQLTIAAAQTIFIVGQVGATPAAGNNDTILGNGANGPTTQGVQIRHQPDGTIDLRLCDGVTRTNVGTQTRAAGTNFIIGVRWDGSNKGIRINGNAEQTSANALGSLGTGAHDIARNAAISSLYWDGEITRLLAAPTTRLGDTNFATAFTELNTIYSIY